MKNFCVNPFYQKSLRRRSDFPCCWLDEIDDDYSHEKLRSDFDKGIKSKYCKTCWISESKGVPSKRIQDNKQLQAHSKKSIETLYAERHKKITRSLQIATSNLCNLACKTCHVLDSTRWYAEHNHFNKDDIWKGTKQLDMTKISDKDLLHLNSLEILGGEPFIDSNHYSLLERLIFLGKNDMSITYTTNGQQMPLPQLMKLLKKFRQVNISLSVDGTGSVFEYMRWPGKWQTTIETMDKLKAIPNFELSVYSSISNMNAFYFPEIVEWNIKNFSITNWTYQTIQYPEHFAPNILPVEAKEIIKEKFLQHKYKKIIQPILDIVMMPYDKALLDKFKITVGNQDMFRKINAKDFVPEIVDYIH
mgnify:FL=1